MSSIQRAVEILKQGGLVAFPTETVYGLGADARNSSAVLKIFLAKGRRPTNPLIVHVADKHTAKRYAKSWPKEAEILAIAFWPGPLTLVLPKTYEIVPQATADKNTVGLRVPNHPLALELLKAFDGPLAAPSANRSNHLSPTQARHVQSELGDGVDLILDGGPCTVGIESTVLDLSTPQPTILRPGHITCDQIESLIGPVQLFTGSLDTTTAASSPGQQEKHYSPITPAYRFDAQQRNQMLARLNDSRTRTALVLCGNPIDAPNIINLPNDAAHYAALLYDTLRRLDQNNYQAIFIEMPPALPEWLAVRDRLTRATLVPSPLEGEG